MIEESLFAVIATGIIFGIVHAFDVDHIAAMATFSDQQKSEKTILKYAFKWGVGHGGILLALGLALIFVGFTLPQWFVHYAEVMVGVLLIYLGLKLVFLMHNKGLLNRSDSLSQQSAIPTKHDHTPLFIGMLHGVAGSAPLLALLPNMLETQFIFHISLFSVGCLFGMFSFGYLFGSYQVHIKNTKENVAKVLTKTLGFSSIGLGTFWVFS